MSYVGVEIARIEMTAWGQSMRLLRSALEDFNARQLFSA